MPARTIVVVEDEELIAEAVAARLRSEGYVVEVVGDGPAAVALCERVRPDLVVLDLMLPGFDGLEVCRRVQRERATPVLMLTARDAETDLLVGLAVGADDYLTKPFSPRELVARVAAILRRVDRTAEAAQASPVPSLTLGDAHLDPATRRVQRGSKEVHLTPTEFDLLRCLADHRGAVLSRVQLLSEVWGWQDGSGARTARAFNAMAAELAEVDRVRKDLVANVSHELRTPITALQAVLENIVDGVAPADPATLRTMLAQVERLGRLVGQLLDLSRLESGTVPLQREDFDVHPVLEDVAALARLHAEADGSGVRVTVRVNGRSPTVDGDAERVHQVVANLVENAVRCSPAGGTVELSASTDQRAVTIAVSDEGPGIAPGEVDRVFERFYRADPARSSTSGGAGLGLAIARWIVDLHGGQIHIEPVHPHGCRMVVILPRGTAR